MPPFENIDIDYSWSFSDKTIKDTSYITHCFYTYPAKFIPQLASRLINELSNENDIIVDPFMGSGTTIVESIVNNRIGIGNDINNIAYLISKVKTTPLNLTKLNNEFIILQYDLATRLNGSYDNFVTVAESSVPSNERIDYWFLPDQKAKLSIILSRILEIRNKDIKNFFLVTFAQILKSCSIWLQKSVKPTRDLNKKIVDPLPHFIRHSKKMIKRIAEFQSLLEKNIKNNIENNRKIYCDDSRKIYCDDNNAQLIVTSPPYVTSYEYADLHQLPSLWFGFMNNLPEFRKKFIGSAYSNREDVDLRSNTADKIINELKSIKKAKEVKNYFADMLESFQEMHRVLRVGGKACIVIGNTHLSGVQILNAEVFQEQFINIGFKTYNIIKREIPSKMLPSTRDSESGQFVSSSNKNVKLVYPTEYILIMEKL